MILVAVITSVIFVFALALGIGLGLSSRESSPQNSGTYEHAAVATDAGPCSQVGVDILKLGGNAVDAAIAATLCVGVVNLHSTGIGGGGFMVYYNSSSGEAHAIDFREKAPMNASTFMYNDTAPDASTRGKLTACWLLIMFLQGSPTSHRYVYNMQIMGLHYAMLTV